MTWRIEKVSVQGRTSLRLSGWIQSEYLAEFETQIETLQARGSPAGASRFPPQRAAVPEAPGCAQIASKAGRRPPRLQSLYRRP